VITDKHSINRGGRNAKPTNVVRIIILSDDGYHRSRVGGCRRDNFNGLCAVEHHFCATTTNPVRGYTTQRRLGFSLLVARAR